MISFFWHWPLRRQIILALGGSILLIGLLSGELVRTIETEYLQQNFEQQSHKMFSILSATTIDAVVSEDQPLLETIINQIITNEPQIHSLVIENEEKEPLVQWLSESDVSSAQLMSFSEEIIFEEESFGRIGIEWDVTELYAKIDRHVEKMSIFLMGAILILALIIISWVHRLVVNPIRKIHERLNDLGRDELLDDLNLKAAQELTHLGVAVDTIGDNLKLKKQREEELEQASRAKSEFMANMSHELRTPLNGVLGMMSLLRETRLHKDQSEYVSVATNSGNALLTLINDILDYSKIEAGKLELEAIDFALRNTVEDSVEPLAEQAQAKGVELATLIGSNVPAVVRGDPTRLRQVITNLVSNAVKFTEQGEVVVRVRLDSEDRDKTLLHFKVTDSGVGISEAARQRIFDSFTQADGSTTRRYGGTGLGLAICRQLVEHMGGEIGVDSIPGEGSTFWFTIQMAHAADGVIEFNPIEDLAGLHTLIVDDNATNRVVLAKQLKSWSMTIDQARSGSEALTKLNQAVVDGKPFALVLIDMIMPGMNGLELSRAIQEAPAIAETKRVLLTSLADRGQAAEAKAAGIHGYLSKPVRQNQLHDCIATVMGLADDEEEVLVTRHNLVDTAARRRRKILVVEDNPVNQIVVQGMLEKLEYGFEVVDNGQEAVKAVADSRYDLVLMDCQMPVMDGYQATGHIRSSEESDRRLPIIALTANAMAGDADKCYAAGMDDYLAKPFVIEGLEEKLTKWLTQPPEAPFLHDEADADIEQLLPQPQQASA